jgi:chromate transporter
VNDALVSLAWRFGLLSLVAVGGGSAMYPQIHADAVTQMHWLTDRTFTELVAIAQFAPGPNVLIVPLIGWHVAGWLGAFVALVAFLTPSSIVTVAAGRALHRRADSPFVVALRGSLRPVAAGLFFASGIALVHSTGVAPGALVITAGVAVLATISDLNPLWWLCAAAALGGIIG